MRKFNRYETIEREMKKALVDLLNEYGPDYTGGTQLGIEDMNLSNRRIAVKLMAKGIKKQFATKVANIISINRKAIQMLSKDYDKAAKYFTSIQNAAAKAVAEYGITFK